jgi:hypothetical protein
MAGEVSVQLPTDPLQKKSFFMTPPTSSSSAKKEADLYSKLKKLQRNLEFLTLQEVRPSNVRWKLITIGIYQRRTTKSKKRTRPSSRRSQADPVCTSRHRPIPRTHRSTIRNRRIYYRIKVCRPNPVYIRQGTSQTIFLCRPTPSFQRSSRYPPSRSRFFHCNVRSR